MLPREHGAWAMLLMPYLAGTLVGGWGGWRSILLLVSVLLLFSASRPLDGLLRHQSRGNVNVAAARRLVAYLALGGLAAASLPLLFGLRELLPLGAFSGLLLSLQLVLRRRRLDRTWPARLMAISALSATAPAAYLAATGAVDGRAIALWILCFLYSGASVFYVRLVYQPAGRLGTLDARRPRAEAGRRMAGYLSAALLVSVGLAAAGWMPPAALVSLLPTIAKAVRAWWHPTFQTSLRRVGMEELRHLALFTVLAVVAFRAG